MLKFLNTLETVEPARDIGGRDLVLEINADDISGGRFPCGGQSILVADVPRNRLIIAVSDFNYTVGDVLLPLVIARPGKARKGINQNLIRVAVTIILENELHVFVRLIPVEVL